MNEIDGYLDVSSPNKASVPQEIPKAVSKPFRGAVKPDVPNESYNKNSDTEVKPRIVPYSGVANSNVFGQEFTTSKNIKLTSMTVTQAFSGESKEQSVTSLQNEDFNRNANLVQKKSQYSTNTFEKPQNEEFKNKRNYEENKLEDSKNIIGKPQYADLGIKSILYEKKLEDLIKVMLKNSVKSYLKQDTAVFSVLNENNDASLRLKFGCQVCGKLKVLMKLECSHSVCAFCYIESVKKLKESISFNSLAVCECPQCGFLPSASFLNEVYPEFPKNANLQRYCSWCRRTLNLFADFPQELRCSHLCLQCYSLEVFNKVKSCMCCEQPFKNIHFTKSRVAKCSSCSKIGLLISSGYRVIHLNHCFCFECLKRIADNFSCLVCEHEITEVEKSIFSNFMNKRCPICGEKKCINEIIFCDYCNKITCDDCAPTYNCNCPN